MTHPTLGVVVTLVLSLLLVPLVAEAQPAHVPRVGVLAVEGGMVSTPERFQVEYRKALRVHGYVEGETILVTYRWVAAVQTERLPDLAVELVHLRVDLFVAFNTPAAHAALAMQHHLPAISLSLTFAEAGGLMTYAADQAGRWRSLATYVDKILKGAKPADLPVERPMQFDLVINLKTAQALGLTMPASLLLQATEVIR
jgi:hypothetical protein